MQVSVGARNNDGARPVTVYSSPTGSPEWTVHVTGVLACTGDSPVKAPASWPPEGAEPVDVSALYDDFAAREYDYGTVFRGVRAAWRRGDEVFTDVVLPDDAARDAEDLMVHPALLDACLHAMGIVDDGDDVQVPFAWRGVTWWRGGATAVRVHLTRVDKSTVSLKVHDTAGNPVLTVDALAFRPLSRGSGVNLRDVLFRQNWTAPSAAGHSLPAADLVVLDGEPAGTRAALARMVEEDRVPSLVAVELPGFGAARLGDDTLAQAARAAVGHTLDLVRAWLSAEHATARLVIVTRNAVAAGADEAPGNAVHAAAPGWCAARSPSTPADSSCSTPTTASPRCTVRVCSPSCPLTNHSWRCATAGSSSPGWAGSPRQAHPNSCWTTAPCCSPAARVGSPPRWPRIW